MGTAKHPHDSKRPESQAVMAALEANDMEALERALSPRQLAFAREYIVDFNASASAIRAGYSPNSSDKMGYILNRHLGVKKYIEYLQTSKAAAIISVTPDYIIQQITAIIHKPGVKEGDVLRALDMLARHKGMYVDRTEITGKDGEALRIQQEKVTNEANDFLSNLRLISKKNEPKKDVVVDE